MRARIHAGYEETKITLVRAYNNFIQMDSNEANIQLPIMDLAYLQKLLDEGYYIEGPKHAQAKDLTVFKKILKRGYNFIPEGWLKKKGYEFVEPCTLTKGFKLAYIIKDDVLIQYFKSNYCLSKKNKKIYLYLKMKKQTS